MNYREINSHIYNFFFFFGIIILIFCLAFFIRYFEISKINNVQCDEPASFLISTPSNINKNGKQFKKEWKSAWPEHNVEYNIHDSQNCVYASNGNIKALIDDLKLIRLQNLDSAHPSLYYSLLRIWDNNLNDFELYKFLFHARFLNLIFFIFSYFFMYKLLNLLSNSKLLISAGLLFTMLNPVGIYITTIAREYELQTMFCIITAYFFFKSYKDIINNKNLNKIEIIKLSFASAGFALSGYFSLIILFLFYLITLLLLIAYKRSYKNVIKFVLAIIFAITLTFILCPNYISVLNSNWHVCNALRSVNNLYDVNNLTLIFNQFCKLINKYMFLQILIVVYLIITGLENLFDISSSKYNNKFSFILFSIFMTAFVLAYFLFYLASFKQLRFIACIFPFLYFIYLYFTNNFKFYISKFIFIAIYLLLFNNLVISVNYNDSDKFEHYIKNNFIDKTLVVSSKDWVYTIFHFCTVGNNNTVIYTKSPNDVIYNDRKYVLIIDPKQYDDVNYSKINIENEDEEENLMFLTIDNRNKSINN